MNYKRREIEQFIEVDLIEAAEAKFKQYAGTGTADLEKELEQLRVEVNSDFGTGTIDAEGKVMRNHDAPKIQRYLRTQEEYRAAALTEEQVNDVFNHVFEFFSRYFYDGDFITRPKDSWQSKYSIPYKGEEVILHWATKNMYYTKTGEFLKKYNFKAGRYKVSFVIVDALVETGNVKGEKNYFILSDKEPVQLDEAASKVDVRFNYRKLTDVEKAKYGTRNIQATLVSEIFEKIRSLLESRSIAGILRPRDGEAKSLMEKHLNSFVKRTTKDFFIHKDLKGFLERELDFYLKNEVWSLDELESSTERGTTLLAAKVKAIRGISRKIIEFLVQIEEFQKRLFDKKKFVLKTDFCITLDLIPEEHYENIGKNESQVKAWKKIYNLNEITKNSLYDVREKNTFNIEFLKKYKYMSLDTCYFDDAFKYVILDKMDDIEDITNGLIIKSENLHALNLLKNKYRESIKCIYIDPPYNTGNDDFLYKDNYDEASWATMIFDRIRAGKDFLTNDGIFLVSIDDRELTILRAQMDYILNKENFICNFIWSTEGHTDNQFQVKVNHEYILCYGKNKLFTDIGYVIDPNTRKDSNVWRGYAENSITKNGPKNPPSKVLLPSGFPCLEKELVLPKTDVDNEYFEEINRQEYITRDITRKYDVTYPVRLDEMIIENNKLKNPCNVYSGWANVNKLRKFINNNYEPLIEKDGNTLFYLSNKGVIYYKKERHRVRNIISVLQNMGTTEKMRSELENMGLYYLYPKPKELIKYILKIGTNKEGTVIDYFAGSGTTAQAIIEMIRIDDFKGKYILIEQADHFDAVIKPRILKNIFSQEWKNGTPLTYDGLSYMLKYQNIEQYEDTLNNIEFRSPDGTIQKTLDRFPDYFISYMLDYETRDSLSRLSIEKFKTPFNYMIKTLSSGEEREESVDLLETFNYLLGLHTKRIRTYKDGDRVYRAVFGERDGELIAVIWRNTSGLDFTRDKNFIEENILVGSNFDVIYVNGDSYIRGAKPIEPEFRRLMDA